jgi:hypothetical protein
MILMYYVDEPGKMQNKEQWPLIACSYHASCAFISSLIIKTGYPVDTLYLNEQ